MFLKIEKDSTSTKYSKYSKGYGGNHKESKTAMEMLSLIHYNTRFHFFTRWKRQKTFGIQRVKKESAESALMGASTVNPRG